MEELCKSCGAEDKDFQFFMPVDIEKGKEGEMRISGVASDESEDLQGEKVFIDGLDISYLLERGAFNWNHSREPGDILGEIDQASKQGGKLQVSGFLYPNVSHAVDTYNLMRSMKDSGSKRKLGLSIEGKIRERAGKEVRKAWLKNVALTYNPINKNTFIDIVKSLGDFTFNKCTGNCTHCTFQETPSEVEKAQGSIIDPRVEVLATHPNTPDEQETPVTICPKCGKNHFGAGDICPEEPRAEAAGIRDVYSANGIANMSAERQGIELGIEKSDKTIKEIIDFLAENPSPQDKDIHGLADKLGIAHDKFETTVYSILGEIVKRGKGVDPDPKELEIGIEVEQEHTKYPELARFIALTHLKELPDYYTKLKAMEANKAKKALGAGYDIPATSGGVSGSAERTETLEKKPKVTTYDERHLGIKKLKKKDVKEMIKSSRGYSDEVSERLTDAIFMMVELQKAGPHKYIKREGMSGSYQYFYQLPPEEKERQAREHEKMRISSMSDKALEARARKIADPEKLIHFHRAAMDSGKTHLAEAIMLEGKRLGLSELDFYKRESIAERAKRIEAKAGEKIKEVAKPVPKVEENPEFTKPVNAGDKVIYFKNKAQAILYTTEMTGQISDGHWENATPSNHYKDMTAAEIRIDPTRPGTKNFVPKRYYGFSSTNLLEAVGDRMLAKVKMSMAFPQISSNDLDDFGDDFESKTSIQSLINYAEKGETYWVERLDKVKKSLGVSTNEELLAAQEKLDTVKYSMEDMKRDLRDMSGIVQKRSQEIQPGLPAPKDSVEYTKEKNIERNKEPEKKPTYAGGGRLIERVFEKAWPGAKSKGSLGHVLTILDKKGDKKVSRHHRIRNGNLELIEEHRRHLKGDGSFKKLLQNSVNKWISFKGKVQGHSFAKWLKENDLEAYDKLSSRLGLKT